MIRLLIIGGASLDVLHLEEHTVTAAGGAGMYAAMASRRCGVQTTLLGPRPDPCPAPLQPVAARLEAWLGPIVSPEELPRFEISHKQGKTEYLSEFFGAEETLSPDMLPMDVSTYDHIHVAALGDANKQLAFIKACRQRGAKQISAGTGMSIVDQQPQAVRAILDQTELFFMNQGEAETLFGSLAKAKTTPGKVLYVTLGAQGACIIQGENATKIPAVAVSELDPTGAGEAFCGATLAFLLQQKHPVMAARHGVALAGEMITRMGPAALLSADRPPPASLEPQVQLNEDQIQKIADKIATLPEVYPFSFVSPELPVVGDPRTVDFFFAGTLQQFSFWSVRDGRYHLPLIDSIDGVTQKGSDYLWGAFKRRLAQESDFCSLERQANLTREDMLALFRADDGGDPMPALDLHLEMAQRYGRDMLALGLTPQLVLEKSLASNQPLQTFISLLDKIAGYKEDPLRKKSSLLAMILNQRPERFLPLREDEEVAPVIDYHAQRFCLRVGVIDVLDEALKNSLQQRKVISADAEWAVRYASYRAIEQVTLLSGRETGAVDWYTFNARRRCPEMTEPECHLCQVDPVCAHRKELFQPVMRTSFY